MKIIYSLNGFKKKVKNAFKIKKNGKPDTLHKVEC